MSRPPTPRRCVPSLTAYATISTRSPTGSPWATVPAPLKAPSTGSKRSSARCTGGPNRSTTYANPQPGMTTRASHRPRNVCQSPRKYSDAPSAAVTPFQCCARGHDLVPGGMGAGDIRAQGTVRTGNVSTVTRAGSPGYVAWASRLDPGRRRPEPPPLSGPAGRARALLRSSAPSDRGGRTIRVKWCWAVAQPSSVGVDAEVDGKSHSCHRYRDAQGPIRCVAHHDRSDASPGEAAEGERNDE